MRRLRGIQHMPQQTKAHFTATKLECWHGGHDTHLIQRLRGRVVLVRRFSYRANLVLIALRGVLGRVRSCKNGNGCRLRI